MIMIHKLIFLILCLMGCLGADAQLRYGLQLGGEFTRPGGAMHAVGGNGFAGGLEAEYQIPSTGLGFDIAALYSRRHINLPGTTDGGTDFISVPLDIRYHLPLGFTRDLAAIFPFTGPDFAWRVDGGLGKRFHPGWRFGVGISVINFVRISGGYRLGINEIAPGIRDSGGFVAASILFDI